MIASFSMGQIAARFDDFEEKRVRRPLGGQAKRKEAM
jgi:hypothetical protein